MNQKASDFLKNLCADIDFSCAGYRPPLTEPLILCVLDAQTIKTLETIDYKPASPELKVLTQKQLFHGMRLKKIAENRALSKADFISMPLKLTPDNLYVGKNKSGAKELRFFWDIDENTAKYAYFTLNSQIWTYGITKTRKVAESKKVKR